MILFRFCFASLSLFHFHIVILLTNYSNFYDINSIANKLNRLFQSISINLTWLYPIADSLSLPKGRFTEIKTVNLYISLVHIDLFCFEDGIWVNTIFTLHKFVSAEKKRKHFDALHHHQQNTAKFIHP